MMVATSGACTTVHVVGPACALDALLGGLEASNFKITFVAVS
jgi:hypothetical protein